MVLQLNYCNDCFQDFKIMAHSEDLELVAHVAKDCIAQSGKVQFIRQSAQHKSI